MHEAEVDKRVQYMCEVMFATRKDGFKEHPSVIEALDLVLEEDQFTHMLTLDDAVNSEDMLSMYLTLVLANETFLRPEFIS